MPSESPPSPSQGKQSPAEWVRRELESVAKKGETLGYTKLRDAIRRQFAGQGNWGRREMVELLDEINRETSLPLHGILLSVVVVNNQGIPDSRFYEKWRDEEWGHREIPGENSRASASDLAIFREELAKVYDIHDAPRKIHVYMDLENIPGEPARGKTDRRTAFAAAKEILSWLAKKENVQISGKAFTAKKEKNPYKSWKSMLNGHKIDIVEVLPTGKNAADAALTMAFGAVKDRIIGRDYACFVVGEDEIYNQLVADALSREINILHFGKADRELNPDFRNYRFFDIDNSDKWEPF